MKRLTLIALASGISFLLVHEAQGRGGHSGGHSHSGPTKGVTNHSTGNRTFKPAGFSHSGKNSSSSKKTWAAKPAVRQIRQTGFSHHPGTRGTKTAQMSRKTTSSKTFAGKTVAATSRKTGSTAKLTAATHSQKHLVHGNSRVHQLSHHTINTLQNLMAGSTLRQDIRNVIGFGLANNVLSFRQGLLLNSFIRTTAGLTLAQRNALRGLLNAAGDFGAPDDMAQAGEDFGTDEDRTEVTDEEEQLFGMQITELFEGTAQSQGMKEGDIILSINDVATPDFDSMRSALENSGSEAEVVFMNIDNGQMERVTLSPEDSRIGASVQQIEVK